MSRTKYPIGLQDFEKIILGGYTYIDKTQYIYQLIAEANPYFLSRPRRFGKSLLISTFAALFSGKRHLFKNLWIDQSDWEWIEYPIIRLDMSTISNRTPQIFEADLIRALKKNASEYGIALSGVSAANCLEDLISQLSSRQKAVVLIDEYDKALIDNIENLETATENRRILRDFYAILKALDKDLKFIFLTGVTQFSKVSIFSGLNNLNDLTMSNDFSTLLGYTRQELEHYFAIDVEKVAEANQLTTAECYQQIREWYNGYKFSKNGETVYNPFSTLKLLSSKDFASHWFETGTPTFLIKLLQIREFDLINIEQYEIAAEDFNTFEIEDLPMLPLLYQTGYLTIKAFDPQINTYRLGYPNREVGQSFTASILRHFATSKANTADHLSQIYRNFSANPWDYARFFVLFAELLALMPYDLYLKQEKHYQSLFYLIIKLAGISVSAEVHTQRGRVDAVIEMKNKIILFEFKLNENAAKAIEQIKKKKYFQSYHDKKIPIYLVGINFNSQLRTMDDWHVEQL